MSEEYITSGTDELGSPAMAEGTYSVPETPVQRLVNELEDLLPFSLPAEHRTPAGFGGPSTVILAQQAVQNQQAAQQSTEEVFQQPQIQWAPDTTLNGTSSDDASVQGEGAVAPGEGAIPPAGVPNQGEGAITPVGVPNQEPSGGKVALAAGVFVAVGLLFLINKAAK